MLTGVKQLDGVHIGGVNINILCWWYNVNCRFRM